MFKRRPISVHVPSIRVVVWTWFLFKALPVLLTFGAAGFLYFSGGGR